jgi:hypothetical protein
MSASGGKHSIESIVRLVFDGRESEALAALTLELGKTGGRRFAF